MRNFFCGSLIGVVIACLGVSAPVHARGRRPPPHWADGVRTQVIAGTPCFALHDVAEKVDGHLHWYPVSKRVDLSFQTHEVQFFVGSNKAVIDGRPVRMDSPPVKEEGSVWVPVSFFQTRRFGRIYPYALKPPPPGPRVEMPGGSGIDATPAPAPAPIPAVPEKPVLPVPAEHHRVRRIVIDPGHGGKDSGAVGARGTMEKAINLEMAEELAEILRQKDYEVLLTRTDDTFVPLEERARMANRFKADLFISLHCNASLSSHLKGFEVYFLSEKASDPHADAVARSENASLALEEKPVSSGVRHLLRSLAKNVYINESSECGTLIDRHVARQMSQPHLGVKQAKFYVLRGAEMPALLIESAFLSNPSEEKLLKSSRYRRQLMTAVELAITEYNRRSEKIIL